MLEQLENVIRMTLSNAAHDNALSFSGFLRDSDLLLENGSGYWRDRHYWMAKYREKYVCFILLDDTGMTLWTDDSGENWFSDCPADEKTRAFAWKNVDICGNCGGCKNPGGTSRTVFGRKFSNVCVTAMKFTNPDSEALEYVKKLLNIRISIIK